MKIAVEAYQITDVTPSLDGITVFWQDLGPSRGCVTIVCYGAAWAGYFGGMGNRTIREFFKEADTSYLVSKLGITPSSPAWWRATDHAYLGRIIDAIKASAEAGL